MKKQRKPMPQGKPMARKTGLKRSQLKPGGSQLKSRGPVKPRKPGVAATPTSSIVPKKLRAAVLKRDDFTCQRCGRVIGNDSGAFFCEYSLQHRDPRGMGGSKLLHTMANLVTLCGSATTPGMCHSHVESYRIESTDDGWLVPNGVVPEEWPVWRFGMAWEQPGDEWVPAEPHERQRAKAA